MNMRVLLTILRVLTVCLPIALLTAPSTAQVAAGSGSYATAWETPIYNDNGFFGPTVPEMQSAYNTLFLDPSLKNAAIPTDKWWTDLMFGFRGSGSWTQQAPWNTQLWVFPELVLPTAQGMSLYFPSTWNPRSGAAEAFNFGTPINVTGANGFAATNPVVKSYGDWTMSYSLTDSGTGGVMTTTLARGVPFVWVQYTNVTPAISGGAFYDANGNQITASTYTGSAVATVVGSQTFGIFAPANTTFTVSGANITPNIPSGSYVVYAVMPDKSYLSTFAQYAYALPTGSKMTYTYNRPAGQIQTTWTLSTTSIDGSSETSTLQGWLPHHYRTTTNNLSFQPFTYLTPRGTLKIAAGNTFNINWPFRGIAPVLPAPHKNDTTDDYSASRMQEYVDAFASAHPGFGGDTYAQGQELGLGAQYLTMADQLGLTADKSAILSNLEKVMDDWYTYTPGEGGSNGASARYFVRDSKYGSFVGNVPGFGSESYNDNHFHYGYFITASALTGMKDPTWLNNYLPLITDIAKDYGNWDRTDTTYPYFRHFDIWEGHCWANGISTSSGENQESSSESMQSWIGLFLLGNISGNQSMADAGAMGYAIESSAANEYWQDWKHTNFPAGYGFNGAGQVTGGQLLYSTNFGGDPAFIYGIQFCPTNHWNNYLVRDTTYAASVLNNLWSERTTAAGEGLFQLNDANNNISVLGNKWGNYWLGYQEMFDPSTVASEEDQYWNANSAVADDGELAGPVYYNDHSLRYLGLQDTNYYTNIPTSAVYVNSNGQHTVVVYNPQSTSQTATVYNNGATVASVSVPAQTEISVVLTSGSGAPITPTGLSGTGGNGSVALTWVEPSTLPSIPVTSYNLYRSTTSGGEGTTPYKTGLTSPSFTDTAVTNGTTYYYTVAAVNASGTSAISGETSSTPAIPPATVTDPLNDFSMVSSKSANWTFDTTNTAFFNGDTSRAIRSTDSTEYLVYSEPNIVGFNVRVFFLGGNLGQVSIYYSTDNGGSWTAAPLLDGVAGAGQAGWYDFNLRNNGALPAGVTNIKIQLATGSGNNWDPQISQVTLSYTGNSGTVPNVPTGISASAGNSQVTLAWTASNGATSYNVYRSTTSGAEGTTAVATGITGTTYTNTGLTNGTKYYYTIAAVNSAGTSAQSTEVNATPQVSLPSTPTGLTATAGNTQVALTWTASTGATSYNVYRSTTSGGEGSTPVASGITSTSYTNTGLTNGTKYYFTVAAVNSAGTSSQSTEVNATPQASIPSTPTGLAANAGNAQVGLTWNASSGATSYNIYRSTVSGGEGSTAYATSTSTAYTDTAVTNNTTYYYKVAAVNSAGTSAQSTEVNATPTAPSGTSGPVSINCGGGAASPFVADADFSGGTTGSTTTTIATPFVSNPAPPQAVLQTWRTGVCTYTLPGFAVGTSATISLYFVEPTATGTGQRDFNVTINGAQVLTNFDTYAAAGGQFRAVQENFNTSVGSSGQVVISFTNGIAGSPIIEGIAVTGTAGGPTVPAAPTGLTPTAGNSQVALSWTASSGATSYNVYRSTTSGGEGSTPIASGITSTTYTNTGLTNGTKYYFTVAAVNSVGTSTQSTEVNATPITVPAAPTGLTATAGNTQVALAWTASSGATSYNVYRSTTSGGEGSTPVATGITSTSYTNTGLTDGTKYYFTVAAVNGAGTSAQSTEASATPQLPPPGAPSNLAATAGNAQVALTWTAGSNASTYNVYRGTAAGAESSTPVATGVTSTSFTDTGLTNGTTYYYKVASVNSTGTSSQSNEASATPAASTTTSGPASINCGGGAASPFVADADFAGGTTGSTTSTVATPFVSNPAPPQAVLQSWRTGSSFTYTMPGFTAGTGHTVSLYFMDPTSTGNGQRNFNVSINGSTVLTNFDVYAASQGQLRAIQENFNATANSSGQIVISFTSGTAGQPIIEGITIPN